MGKRGNYVASLSYHCQSFGNETLSHDVFNLWRITAVVHLSRLMVDLTSNTGSACDARTFLDVNEKVLVAHMGNSHKERHGFLSFSCSWCRSNSTTFQQRWVVLLGAGVGEREID